MLRTSFNLFLFLVLHYQTLTLTSSTDASTQFFNISHYLYPKATSFLFSQPPSPTSQPSFFLKDILEAIAKREKWDLEDIRVSKLDARRGKYRKLWKYEFGVRLGKTEFVFKVFDQVSQWTKFESMGKRNWSDFESLIKEIGSKAVLDGFKIEGPLELYAAGDHHLTLNLPLNTSIPGLKQILVSEGITIEVEGAEEITVFHTPTRSGLFYGNAFTNMRSESQSSCLSLLPIRVRGSASVTVYRTKNPDASIRTSFLSRGTVKLLPEKCYMKNVYRKQSSVFDSLSQRVTSLENVLKSFLGGRTNRNTGLGLKIRIKPSYIFRFQIELERNISSNDTYWSTLGEWRTRPAAERVWFEVVAGIGSGFMKPFTIRKVRPFIEVDSLSWSSLMSNISFTNFPSFLVPPEPLTLDVKW
nr:uncharacterized protein LOC109170426 [Ipomoea trifida]